jgi:hypothetical protein
MTLAPEAIGPGADAAYLESLIYKRGRLTAKEQKYVEKNLEETSVVVNQRTMIGLALGLQK